MQAGGKPIVGRMHVGWAPCRLASSTKAEGVRSRDRSSMDSTWAIARGRALAWRS